MTDGPVFVASFAGAAADWLALVDPALDPLVSWMGGKRRWAVRCLRILGLEAGLGTPSLLGDLSWWGWVWPLALDPSAVDDEHGRDVAAWLRSWRAEDPRGLWFRLRDAGPPVDPVERAAGLLWLQARAASGVPVWWEGDPGGRWLGEAELVSMAGHGYGPYRAWQNKAPGLVQWASTKVDQAGQLEAPEPRLVQDRGFGATRQMWLAKQKIAADPRLLASDGRGVAREAGHKAEKSGEVPRAGGMQYPATIADRIDAVRRRAPSVRVEHRDALEQAEEWAPRLGDRARVSLDPPYQGATGYPAECPRGRVLATAELWARYGARVVVHEAENLAQDLGPGWTATCLREGRKPEWITTYGCAAGAAVGPLFTGSGAA